MELDTVVCGDCLDVMGGMPDNIIDTVLTDPPYGLSGEPDMAEVLTHWLAGDDYEHRGGGFMGKSWDSFVPGPSVWREVYRVMKPGGTLLAFGGTRTNDLLSIAIRLAGFQKFDEIDYYYGGLPPQMAWVTGQGFPKSLDVSKAIDKRGGVSSGFEAFRDDVKRAMKQSGTTRAELQEALGNYMLSHYLTKGSQPAIPSWQDYQIIRDTVGLDSRWDAMFAPEAEREVIGHRFSQGGRSGSTASVGQHLIDAGREMPITSPATEAAARWSGYGTGLKPAHEVILCFYKPREGSYASNALAWGVAGLWIDGGRIGTNGNDPNYRRATGDNGGADSMFGVGNLKRPATLTQGRWPSNFLLTHAPGCRRRGTRRVRGSHTQGIARYRQRGQGGIWRDSDGTPCGQDHTDPDGLETVDEWECEDGCPVSILAAQSGERPHSWRSDEPKYYGEKDDDWFGLGNRRNVGYKDHGTAARFFYQSKASRRERNMGCEDVYWRKDKSAPIGFVRIGKDEWDALPEKQRARGNIHCTVKPLGIVEYLCRLTRTPTGGVVFDPFCGTGTTALGAIRTGRRWLGCDNEPDYVYLANLRIEALKQETPQMELALT